MAIIDVEELIRSLATLSPMPDDDDPNLTVDRLRIYDELLRRVNAFLEQRQTESNLDQQLIRALIDSFGYGLGYGLYWTTLHTLEKFPIDRLHQALQDTLKSGAAGARMWSALMLGSQRNLSDLPLLIAALQDRAPRVRIWVLGALAMLGDSSARAAIASLFNDPDEEVRKKAHWTAERLSGVKEVGRD